MREALLLASILLPIFGMTGGYWQQQYGASAVLPYCVAAACCTLFGVLALVVQEIGLKRGAISAGGFGSIACRTLGPMLSAVLIGYLKPEWREHQVFLAFVSCYLLTLFVETILSVRLVHRWEASRTADADS